jgi:lipopolysaccharide export system protein LptC
MAVIAKARTPHRKGRPARIKALRRTLPVVAGLLLVVCAGQVAWRTMKNDAAVAAAGQAVSMTAPRFYGVTRTGRSFVITGREGQRNPTGDGVRISDPVIDLSQGAEGERRLTAKSGVYTALAHNLLLEGDVRMIDASGSELASDRAVINTQTGEVSGQTGLKASSGVGQVTSKSYDIRDRGDRLVFKGGVRARLPQK